MNTTPTKNQSATTAEQDDLLPRHIAIIMDGNGRWARAQGKPRSMGHAAGAEAVRPIVTRCAELGVEALTLYSFSTENWSRHHEEIDFLMDLYVQYLISERSLFLDNNVRLIQIGRRDGLPAKVLDELDRTIEMTQDHTGLTLALAINYGARAEIIDAVQHVAARVKAGELDPRDITEATLEHHLYTAGLPDPDLLIRTAGEMRLSNYLLWQISYAEFYVADCCWPEFDASELDKALDNFRGRTRRYGAVVEE